MSCLQSGESLFMYDRKKNSCPSVDLKKVWIRERLYQLFYSEIGGSGIDSNDATGGCAAFPRASSEQGRQMKLSIRFGIRMPGYLLPSRTIWTVETVYIQPWTGESAEMYSGAGEYGQSGQVYVAENGSYPSRFIMYVSCFVHSCLFDVIGSAFKKSIRSALCAM